MIPSKLIFTLTILCLFGMESFLVQVQYGPENLILKVRDGDNPSNYIDKIFIRSGGNPSFYSLTKNESLLFTLDRNITINIGPFFNPKMKITIDEASKNVKYIEPHIYDDPFKNSLVSGNVYFNHIPVDSLLITDLNNYNVTYKIDTSFFSITPVFVNGSQRIKISLPQYSTATYLNTTPTIDITVTTDDEKDDAKIDVYFDDLHPKNKSKVQNKRQRKSE